MKNILIALSIALLSLGLLVSRAEARDSSQITDWYIKDFQSEIIVNTDSSLHITEKITADCGNLPGKHGIFRTLPTFYQATHDKSQKLPVHLVSITDFDGNPITYSTSKSLVDGTITWKIGDANKTVHGENHYKIVYDVQNAIRFDGYKLGIGANFHFDEFYWNLTGNFWQIDIDAAEVTVKFPDGVHGTNNLETETNIYTGAVNGKGKDAVLVWIDDNTLKVTSTKSMKPGEGMTASVTFLKGIFQPYKPTWLEKNGKYLWLLMPIITFLICFHLWKRYGDDPSLGRTIIAEYDVPDKLPPIEFGMLLKSGKFSNNLISAAIINLAVNKVIKIEEVGKRGLLGKADYRLIRLNEPVDLSLSLAEEVLLEGLLGGSQEVEMSSLKNKFYTHISSINNKAKNYLVSRGYFQKTGFSLQIVFFVAAVVAAIVYFIIGGIAIDAEVIEPVYAVVSGILTILIIIIFAILMPQMSLKGAETQWKVKGFRLYMETAEKYREQFNEKENIFEKFLPYAMVFGIVGLWIQKMKTIYGEDYFNTYHPYWYGGYVGNFNANSLADSINSVSHSMVTTMASSPSSSGSGGGGFSGGGGGGGGGGGW